MYSQNYLNGIKQTFNTRIDGNSGKKDGKVTVAEAYKDLNVGDLLSGLKPNSQEYNKLSSLTNKIPQALQRYAGSDGVFTENEWADFLNGSEWGAVLDTYHSSSNWAETEMAFVDNAHNSKDGMITCGEVKVGLLNSIDYNYSSNFDTTELEAIVDNYAGDDGIFTKEEYTKMLNDPRYKSIIKQTGASPSFTLKNSGYGNNNINSNIAAQNADWSAVGTSLGNLFTGIINKIFN